MDRDMEKPGRSDYFPEETGCKSWFFVISARTKLKCAINNSSQDSKKNKKKQKKEELSPFRRNMLPNGGEAREHGNLRAMQCF